MRPPWWCRFSVALHCQVKVGGPVTKTAANYQMIQNYKSKSWEYIVLAQGDRTSIVFTDEKDYSLDITKNRQNDRVYWPSKKANIASIRLHHESSRFSKKTWSLPVFLGREKQISTLLTHRELKLTAKPISICSINIYYQTAGPCIPKTTTYSSRIALHLIPAEPVQIIWLRSQTNL